MRWIVIAALGAVLFGCPGCGHDYINRPVVVVEDDDDDDDCERDTLVVRWPERPRPK